MKSLAGIYPDPDLNWINHVNSEQFYMLVKFQMNTCNIHWQSTSCASCCDIVCPQRERAFSVVAAASASARVEVEPLCTCPHSVSISWRRPASSPAPPAAYSCCQELKILHIVNCYEGLFVSLEMNLFKTLIILFCKVPDKQVLPVQLCCHLFLISIRSNISGWHHKPMANIQYALNWNLCINNQTKLSWQ